MSVGPESATTPSARALSAAAFAAVLAAALPTPCRRLAVAVSGGPDSMALLRLAHEWAAPRDVELTALTVDHRLRVESAAEAAQVAAWCDALGIRHRVLPWTAGETVRSLARSAQEAARDARYRLLTDECRAHGVDAVLLAHHADDQIETFLMRLARGSGLDGLAAMDPAVRRGAVLFLRPLLDASKDDLIATCARFGQAWIADPSNDSAKYTRARFRRTRAVLAAEGLTRERLLATIGHLRRARAAIALDVMRLHDAACVWSDLGVATISAPRLFDAPAEVGLRLLARVLTRAGGQGHGPRFDALARLFDRLRPTPTTPATLHGCRIARAGDAVTVSREARGLPAAMDLAPGATIVWDNRFAIARAEGDAATWRLRPYRAEDRAFWRAQGDDDALADIPAPVRLTLPVIEDAQGVLAMPHADLWRQGVGAGRDQITICFASARDDVSDVG